MTATRLLLPLCLLLTGCDTGLNVQLSMRDFSDVRGEAREAAGFASPMVTAAATGCAGADDSDGESTTDCCCERSC